MAQPQKANTPIDLSSLTETEKEFMLYATNGIISAMMSINNRELLTDFLLETMRTGYTMISQKEAVEFNHKMRDIIQLARPDDYVYGEVTGEEIETANYKTITETAILKNMYENS